VESGHFVQYIITMPVLHLICGLPGSGKSTLAHELEHRENTIWLSADEWMSYIVGDGYDEKRRAAIEQVQWQLAKKLVKLGVNVVLDNGFWSRSEREGLRKEAADLGARTELHVLDVPLAELQKRIAKRNRALPANAFPITEQQLEEWSKLFERPRADELRQF
jgi:predicted kinase